MSQQMVILLLGSNLGNPEENIHEAIVRMEKDLGAVLACSDMMRTKAVEFDSDLIFCNIAVRLQTELSPISLLNAIKNIEVSMGRVEDSSITGEYRDRVIDIDIVRYGRLSFESPRLQIPHYKHIHERYFSRKLLSEINN